MQTALDQGGRFVWSPVTIAFPPKESSSAFRDGGRHSSSPCRASAIAYKLIQIGLEPLGAIPRLERLLNCGAVRLALRGSYRHRTGRRLRVASGVRLRATSPDPVAFPIFRELAPLPIDVDMLPVEHRLRDPPVLNALSWAG